MFAGRGVGHAERHARLHPRDRRHRAFHLGERHLHAVADGHVLDPSDDPRDTEIQAEADDFEAALAEVVE